MDGKIFGWIFGWKNIWMDQDVGGAVAHSLCRARGNLHQYWWTRLWAPACWLPNSVWLVWFILMFLFVSCFRTSVPKWEKEQHSRAICSGSLMSCALAYCGFLAFTFNNNERQGFGLLGKIKCTAPHEYNGQVWAGSQLIWKPSNLQRLFCIENKLDSVWYNTWGGRCSVLGWGVGRQMHPRQRHSRGRHKAGTLGRHSRQAQPGSLLLSPAQEFLPGNTTPQLTHQNLLYMVGQWGWIFKRHWNARIFFSLPLLFWGWPRILPSITLAHCSYHLAGT